jgi:hypothetical protein
VRGKKGNAAANRRNLQDLEHRATEAERRADKAEAQVLELKERLERTTTGLQRELAEMRKQRDEAAAPAVATLEQQLVEVRQQKDAADERADAQQKRHEITFKTFKRTLMKMGFSQPEAVEIVMATTTDVRDDFRLVAEDTGISKSAYKRIGRNNVEAVDRLQTARGVRRNSEIKAALIAAVNATDDEAGA